MNTVMVIVLVIVAFCAGRFDWWGKWGAFKCRHQMHRYSCNSCARCGREQPEWR